MGLIFDGIDLKTNYNFVVTNINGRGSPPVSRTMLELPRIDGAIELNSKLQSRNVTIRGYVYGTDASTKKDALIKLITQAYSQEKKLTFPDTNRSIYVKLAGEPVVIGPVGPVLNAQAYELTFNFVAQDPYFYADEHNESGFRIIKVNAHAPTYLISPRRKFLKREAAFKIEPYTIVNLLGKYGDFEVGSGGIADGWNAWNATGAFNTTSLFGSYSQTATGDGSNDSFGVTYSIDITEAHKYYMSVYAKVNDNTNGLELGIYTLSGSVNWISSIKEPTESWQLVNRLFSCNTTGTAKLLIFTRYLTSAEASGKILYLDGAMLVDLTAMGSLPYGLQQYFSPSGITKWEDLATTSNIEALGGRVQSGEDWLAELLPFVNGVKTLGFAWEGI